MCFEGKRDTRSCGWCIFIVVVVVVVVVACVVVALFVVKLVAVNANYRNLHELFIVRLHDHKTGCNKSG